MSSTIYVKNMVCDRCKMAVTHLMRFRLMLWVTK